MAGMLSQLTTLFLNAGEDGAPALALNFVWSLHTCVMYRRAMEGQSQPWLQTLVSCLIGTFGGTSMTSLALGVPMSFLTTINTPLAFFAAWWLVFCSPGDIPALVLSSSRELRFLLELANCLAGAHAVTSWGADRALSNVHLRPNGSGPLTIICGMLSASGGGILCLWFGINGKAADWSFRTPPTLRRVGVGVKNGLFCSMLYYVLRNPNADLPWAQDLIPKGEAGVAVWALWTAVTCALEAGLPDPYAPLSNLLGLVTFVPHHVPRPSANTYTRRDDYDKEFAGASPPGRTPPTSPPPGRATGRARSRKASS